MPGVPALNLKDKEGEKLESNEDWKVLLSNEALHYQDALQDELSHPTAKVKLQVRNCSATGILCFMNALHVKGQRGSIAVGNVSTAPSLVL